MFKKILIANRGEIALRVIRACRELGIETVAVYSEADRESLHVRFADDDVCIGPPPARDSYLKIPRLIAAAEITGADAIHPGYGFLAENDHFAEVCRACKIHFIGPTPEVIAALGDKVRARELARAAGVPVVPGSDGEVEDEKQALEIAQQIGYPIMIKAAAGGGGRGMRVARNEPSLVASFHQASSEAKNAFGDGTVYLEKFVENPRHIEVKILADNHGTIVHLGERDCSIQRRHQKLIEESPSPALDADTREEMEAAAERACRTIGYENAGTFEFLLSRDGSFYFIEVNARIQVEHTVTELVTGLDLIQQQILIASGERLAFGQQDVKFSGHALECRINAEDPDKDFQPSPGLISLFVPPGGPGVRLDSHCYSGYRIPPNYDSMIGKLLVHRPRRDLAIRTMLRALDEFVIQGPKTTIPLHGSILRHSDFRAGDHDTGFVERYYGSHPAIPVKEARG